MSNARNLANLLGTNTKVKDVDVDGTELILDADGDSSIQASADDTVVFKTNNTTALTINSSSLVLPKMPILQVSATDTDQSVSGGTDTKVEWETVELDTLSGWSTSNHRYTPTVAGYYLVGGTVRALLNTVVDFVKIAVSKNGFDTNDGTDMLINQFNHQNDTIEASSIPIPTGLIQMNGSSDYIEVFFKTDEACTLHDASSPKSFFFAQLVHAT